MSGMEPMLIGAALGGGASAAMGKNPIQGALLGGIGGGVFGAAGSAANAANATAAGTSVIPYAGAEGVLAAPTFMQTVKAIPSAISQGAMSSPNLAMQGFGAAQGLMAPEEMPMPQSGQVSRGQARQYESLLNPKFAGVQRPQPISLI